MALSDEAKARKLKYIQGYDRKNYYRLLVKFRLDSDKDLIDYLDTNRRAKGTIIKEALREYIKKVG